MTDALIVWYLLANYASLIAVVPADSINHVVIPQGSTAPALAVNHITTMRRQFVSATATNFCTARVQVTVLAADLDSLKSVLTLVRAALPRSTGTVNSISVDSILPDVEGPIFTNEAGIYVGSLDYIVKFTE